MRVELTDNNWAELADPQKVSERKRRTVVSKITGAIDPSTLNAIRSAIDAGEASAETAAEMMTGSDMTTLLETIDVAIAALVREWSFPVEVTLDAVLDLNGDDYDRLRDACYPLMDQLAPKFDPNPDRSTPTGPSSD